MWLQPLAFSIKCLQSRSLTVYLLNLRVMTSIPMHAPVATLRPALPAGRALLPPAAPRQLPQGAVRATCAAGLAPSAACCLHCMGMLNGVSPTVPCRADAAPWHAMPCHATVMSRQAMPPRSTASQLQPTHPPAGLRRLPLGAMQCGTTRTHGWRRRGSAAAGRAERSPPPSAGSRRVRGSLHAAGARHASRGLEDWARGADSQTALEM